MGGESILVRGTVYFTIKIESESQSIIQVPDDLQALNDFLFWIITAPLLTGLLRPIYDEFDDMDGRVGAVLEHVDADIAGLRFRELS